MKNQVGVALGSNISGPFGEPRQQLEKAVQLLQKLFPLGFQASSIHATSPLGPQDQPDFCNMALVFESESSPEDLLRIFKGLEVTLGRRLRRRWGEREIDIDLLYVGDEIRETKWLKIPHPEMNFRTFVLEPLSECEVKCKYLQISDTLP